MSTSLTATLLHNEYKRNGKSVADIACQYGCSASKVNYWLKKFNIQKRSISDAVYIKANPKGDPFIFNKPQSAAMWFLYGLGMGLYWGEGNKANKHAVRIGNSDPKLLKTFLRFLVEIYSIDKTRLRFGLQLFRDTDSKTALRYWCKELNLSENQFQKVVVTPSRGAGTYRKKHERGVLTIYFSNKKLRDTICSAIEQIGRE